MRARVLLTGHAAGAWSLALDDAILRLAPAGAATLRVYGVRPGTIILGGDAPWAALSAAERARWPIARRIAHGPSTIVRDDALCFSLTTPAPLPIAAAGEAVEAVERAVQRAVDALAAAIDAPSPPCRAALSLSQRKRGQRRQVAGALALRAAAGAAGGVLDAIEAESGPIEDDETCRESLAAELVRALRDALSLPGGPAEPAARPEAAELALANRLCFERYARARWVRRR